MRMPDCLTFMLQKNITEQIGRYAVTPLTQTDSSGQFVASVSIRRGVYDRVFRFIPQFASESLASGYALAEARSMVLQHQLS